MGIYSVISIFSRYDDSHTVNHAYDNDANKLENYRYYEVKDNVSNSIFSERAKYRSD